MEETQAQLLPHTNRWPCRAVMSCNTDLQSVRAAASLLPPNPLQIPDLIGKGIVGNVVLVAKLTQHKIITVVKSEMPGRC